MGYVCLVLQVVLRIDFCWRWMGRVGGYGVVGMGGVGPSTTNADWVSFCEAFLPGALKWWHWPNQRLGVALLVVVALSVALSALMGAGRVVTSMRWCASTR